MPMLGGGGGGRGAGAGGRRQLCVLQGPVLQWCERAPEGAHHSTPLPLPTPITTMELHGRGLCAAEAANSTKLKTIDNIVAWGNILGNDQP